MSKVYTKTGDKGTTSLIGGTRVKKSDIRINSYGTVDELNSFVGLLATYVEEQDTTELLAEMQNVLFNIGCNLAMGENFKKEIKESVVADVLIEHVEKAIDRMQAAIPELKSFVIPGGSRSASIAHVCRTVCRRAERLIIALDETSEVDKNLMAYVNRLSDYFFVLSRYLNNIEKVDEKNMAKSLQIKNKIVFLHAKQTKVKIYKPMYWTLELASKLEDAPWPATKEELIDYAVRSGSPLEVLENLQEIEDEGDVYDSIEDIWPDYPSKDDFLWNEDEY